MSDTHIHQRANAIAQRAATARLAVAFGEGFAERAHSVTAHAKTRMAQRGVAERDLALIELLGSEVEGGYLVREKDFQEFARDMKQLLQRARRLVGLRLVEENGQVVTTYRANRRKEHHLLRTAPERNLA